MFDIGLPLTREFADYPARMGDAIKTLGSVRKIVLN